MTASDKDYIELGKISGLFGIKGWVKLYSYTRPRISIADYKQFYMGDNKSEITFTQIKESSKHVIAHIGGINERDDAMRFMDQVLYVKSIDLPELTNEYYWHELVGLAVKNTEGHTLGSIKELMETGAHDVIVIQNEKHEETLIPYVMSHFVVSIDLDLGVMTVNWDADD